jgi:hypothetical protein
VIWLPSLVGLLAPHWNHARRLTLITTNFYTIVLHQWRWQLHFRPSSGSDDSSHRSSISFARRIHRRWSRRSNIEVEVMADHGGTWIDRNSTFDPVAFQPVGYGYSGSPDSQNRTIQEVAAGFQRVSWNKPNYGLSASALRIPGMSAAPGTSRRGGLQALT